MKVDYMKTDCVKGNNSYPRILTDETIRENITHGNDNYPFEFYLEDIWQFEFHCIDWHWHSELEFVCVEKGQATVLAGSSRYVLSPGEGIFINRQVIHRFESLESTIIPNIVFSPALLAPEESLIYQKYILPILSSSIDCQVFKPDIEWQKEIIDILGTIYDLQNKSDSCELLTVRLLLKAWNIMYDNMETMSNEQNNKADIQAQARLQIMLQYIQENYQGDITLDKLMQVISLSKSSIINIFKKYVHMSPIDYVIHYRLKQAARLLDTTENTVISIGESVGFDNTGYFCRKFKAVFGVTPSQYRKARHDTQKNV